MAEDIYQIQSPSWQSTDCYQCLNRSIRNLKSIKSSTLSRERSIRLLEWPSPLLQTFQAQITTLILFSHSKRSKTQFKVERAYKEIKATIVASYLQRFNLCNQISLFPSKRHSAANKKGQVLTFKIIWKLKKQSNVMNSTLMMKVPYKKF